MMETTHEEMFVLAKRALRPALSKDKIKVMTEEGVKIEAYELVVKEGKLLNKTVYSGSQMLHVAEGVARLLAVFTVLPAIKVVGVSFDEIELSMSVYTEFSGLCSISEAFELLEPPPEFLCHLFYNLIFASEDFRSQGILSRCGRLDAAELSLDPNHIAFEVIERSTPTDIKQRITTGSMSRAYADNATNSKLAAAIRSKDIKIQKHRFQCQPYLVAKKKLVEKQLELRKDDGASASRVDECLIFTQMLRAVDLPALKVTGDEGGPRIYQSARDYRDQHKDKIEAVIQDSGEPNHELMEKYFDCAFALAEGENPDAVLSFTEYVEKRHKDPNFRAALDLYTIRSVALQSILHMKAAATTHPSATDLIPRLYYKLVDEKGFDERTATAMIHPDHTGRIPILELYPELENSEVATYVKLMRKSVVPEYDAARKTMQSLLAQHGDIFEAVRRAGEQSRLACSLMAVSPFIAYIYELSTTPKDREGVDAAVKFVVGFSVRMRGNTIRDLLSPELLAKWNASAAQVVVERFIDALHTKLADMKTNRGNPAK